LYIDEEIEKAYLEATNAYEVASLYLEEDEELYIRLLLELAYVLKDKGEYSQSMVFVEKALSINLRVRGETHQFTFEILFLKARNLKNLRKY
jgi:hypothetical protein